MRKLTMKTLDGKTHTARSSRKEPPMVVSTELGTMTFSPRSKAYEFFEAISGWPGFTNEMRPRTIAAAVEYHLAYERGGVEAVYERYRARALEDTVYEMAKRTRYELSRMAPRDSHEYRSHYDSWYPSYKWGG